MLSIFPSAYLQSVYLLWWEVRIFYSLISWAVFLFSNLQDSFTDLSLFSLCILIFEWGAFSSQHQWRLPSAPPHRSPETQESPRLSEGMWSAHLLVIYLLRICLAGKEPVPAASACFCDTWREITPVNLNASAVFSCRISCAKNLQNLPFPWPFLSFLPLPHVVSTCQMQSMHLLIFAPSYNELLEVAVCETNEKRKLPVHGLEDVVLTTLEKKTCLQVSQ